MKLSTVVPDLGFPEGLRWAQGKLRYPELDGPGRRLLVWIVTA